MLDNKYSQMESYSAELVFGLIPTEDGKSTSFAYYYPDNRFEFQFTRTGIRNKGEPNEEEVVIETKEKKRLEGRKKKVWVTEDIVLKYNEIKETKLIISF